MDAAFIGATVELGLVHAFQQAPVDRGLALDVEDPCDAAHVFYLLESRS
ncbi:hypothetical protein ECTPHS_06402 [Ectothiorhodospira sp. PHS-1]|nr:hypothetical protein ECTPHS_06402 [Ectothiorhodospira sp. PHS-1]